MGIRYEGLERSAYTIRCRRALKGTVLKSGRRGIDFRIISTAEGGKILGNFVRSEAVEI